MKTKVGIFFALVFAVTTIIFLAPSDGQASLDQANTEFSAPPACPTGTVTVQGCIDEEDGCPFVNTINGRKIYLNLTSVSVGDGDEASLTGFFVTDADCAPCVLKVTSATDLGDC